MDDSSAETEAALSRLLRTLHTLRGPQGCPWDREQTPRTLRAALLEECWELIDAIDQHQEERIDEELGDSLLVVFLMTFSSERSLARIFSKLDDKLVSRHPHVFGDTRANSAEQALDSWHNAKFSQRTEKLLDSIPHSLPPLERAAKMQRRAARVGFDWARAKDVAAQVEEELGEWRASTSPEQQQEELGDLLFSVVNLIRFQGFDPSLVLQQCNRKFYQRFSFIEHTLRQRGLSLKANPPTDVKQAMEELWQKSKTQAEKK